MIYPDTFEKKIGFDEIRSLLRERCLCGLGREEVDALHFMAHADEVNERLCQVREFRQIRESGDDFMSDAKAGRIWPQSCEDVVSGYRIDELLPDDFVETIEEFDRERMLRAETYDRVGGCTPIPL